MSVKASLPGAKLWTPDTPTLYTARLSLLQGRQSPRRGRKSFRDAAVHDRRPPYPPERQAAHAPRLRRRSHLSRADGDAFRQGIASCAAAADQVVRIQPRPPPQHDHAAGVLRRMRRSRHDQHGGVQHLLQPLSPRDGRRVEEVTCRRAPIPAPRWKPTDASGRPRSSDTGTIPRSSAG